jgi:hypothetical protein
VSESTWPSSSTRLSRSPSGSITAPTWAPEARTRLATFSACFWRSKLMAPMVDAYGFTASTSAPSLASTLGMTNEVDPKA